MRMGYIEYNNPWYTSGGISPAVYKHNDVPYHESTCKRGIVAHVLPKQWDYIVTGRVVTQRAGFNKEHFKQIIAFLLDGGPSFMGSDRILQAYQRFGPVLEPEHRCKLCNELEADIEKDICDICYKRISKGRPL